LPLNQLESLVDMASVAAIGSMHTASTSSLETRPAGQGAPKLHHHTADLITHGSVALVVVDWRGAAVVAAGSAGGPSGGGSGGSGSCGGTLGASLAASHQACLERWACSSACSTGSTGSVAACKRHGC
jgi:hypothetical protein